MDLYLIRHAQSENNALPEDQRVEDPPITPIGIRQAELLAEWIPQLQLTCLISSPFRRTLETTQPLARSTGLTPRVRIDLHELGGCMRGPSPDVMEGRPGMTRSQIAAEFSGFELHSEISEAGWWGCQPYETYDRARSRAQRLLKATLEEFADTNHRVAYVMHGDFKRIFLECFHDESFSSPWNTSVTHVQIQNKPRLIEFNRIDHLNGSQDDLLTC